MNERKKALLSQIINEYIKTAQPISSRVLVDKYGLDLSPATVRNEMVELTQEGYLIQPHTSAGRVPTEKAFQFYIKNFLREGKLNKKDKALIQKNFGELKKQENEFIKDLAKTLASLSREAVVVGFSANNVYYTGLSNIFRQPEFAHLELVTHLSEVVDHLDEVVTRIFDQIGKEVKILVGRENPFGEECAALLTKYKISQKPAGMLGIIGPMRMSYGHNLALIKCAQEMINNL
jgi:heat-inducible transcriptional repressor